MNLKISMLVTGSELLDGHVVDANTSFLARELASIGCRLEKVIMVRDDIVEISGTLKKLAGETDLVVVSGGIGPTDDDVTMAATAKAAGTDLTDGIPSGSLRLKNGAGTADGACVSIAGSKAVVFAGVPSEFQFSIRNHLIPMIKSEKKGDTVTDVLLLKTFGIRESKINEIIGPEIKQIKGLNFSYLPVFPEIHLRISTSGIHADNMIIIDKAAGIIRELLGNHVWGSNDDLLPAVTGKRLRELQLKLATAESCTGGLIADRVTSVPGSADYFLEGIVSYSNRSKIRLLGVPPDTISENGAVSEETVRAMAEGIQRLSGAEVTAAVSGIAGPGGGTAEKPVGTVFIAIKIKDRTIVEHRVMNFGRERFKIAVASFVLWLIWKNLAPISSDIS